MAKIAIKDHLEFSNTATPLNIRSSGKTVGTPDWMQSFSQNMSDLECDISQMPENTEAVDAYNNAMDEISRHVPKHQFTPLTHQLNKSWENAPEHECRECTKRAGEGIKLICGIIAPDDDEALFQSVCNLSLDKSTPESVSDDLIALMTAFRDAPTRNLKTQILSIYAYEYSAPELQRLHEPYCKVTMWQIKRAREHAKNVGPGTPVEKVHCHCIRLNMGKVDHFVSFVDRTYFYQDVAYGTRKLKFDSSEKIVIPNIIRTVTRSTMITQYLKYCKEESFDPLSRATLYRILEVREASQQQSLAGIDNTAAVGAEAFNILSKIIDQLQKTGVEKEWCSDSKKRLGEARLYLKTHRTK